MSKIGWFAGIVVLVMAGLTYWAWSDPKMKLQLAQLVGDGEVIQGGFPAELGDEFDPIVTQSRYMVDVGETKGDRLQLEYIFPAVHNGIKLETQLVCEDGVRVRVREQKPEKRVGVQESLRYITSDNSPIVLIGLCGESECKSIVGECELYLSGAKAKL